MNSNINNILRILDETYDSVYEILNSGEWTEI